jgi:carbohydrate-binding DOMON domain-containing protein
MAPRVIPVALLVVAVALAGCGATFGSPGMDTTPADTETRSTTATPTVTETPTVSATPTTAPTSDGISLPPGVTGEGVDDPLALTSTVKYIVLTLVLHLVHGALNGWLIPLWVGTQRQQWATSS